MIKKFEEIGKKGEIRQVRDKMREEESNLKDQVKRENFSEAPEEL